MLPLMGDSYEALVMIMPMMRLMLELNAVEAAVRRAEGRLLRRLLRSGLLGCCWASDRDPYGCFFRKLAQHYV